MQHIYKITNVCDGKFYVGRTDNLSTRFSTHKKLLNKGIHHCIHLQRAWDKYGEANFIFRSFKIFNTGKALDDLYLAKNLEQHFLDTFLPRNLLYNTSCSSETGAVKGKAHHFYGKNPREWMGEAAYEEALRKLRDKTGIANHFYKKTHSQEVIEVLRKKCAMYGTNNPFFGKEHSEESKEKISKKKKGKQTGVSPINAKQVIINGTFYNSCTEAATIIGISNVAISNRCKNPNFPSYKFVNDEDESSVSYVSYKQVVIDEILYGSITAASKILNVNRETIKKRCKSEGFPNYYYFIEERDKDKKFQTFVPSKERKLIHTEETKRRISNSKGRRVRVKGTVYDSLVEAGITLGISNTTIRNRCENPNFPDYMFIE
ncbi:TPA: GIY-YIG nuclease family protein [Bacillus pseudomycoides]|nr:GIY-YIG nuclease family protein [Bacillus pseudomycoides]